MAMANSRKSKRIDGLGADVIYDAVGGDIFANA